MTEPARYNTINQSVLFEKYEIVEISEKYETSEK